VKCIHFSQAKDKWQKIVNTTMNIEVSYN